MAFGITAAAAGRQDIRRHQNRVTLLLGCNKACSVFVHGHLTLLRHGQALHLRSQSRELAAGHSERVEMGFSPATLQALRSTLRSRHVAAVIEADATSSSGARQRYVVQIGLGYR